MSSLVGAGVGSRERSVGRLGDGQSSAEGKEQEEVGGLVADERASEERDAEDAKACCASGLLSKPVRQGGDCPQLHAHGNGCAC